MDHELQIAAEKVLKQKTKLILAEIKRLMEKDGVKEGLIRRNKKDKVPGNSQFSALMTAVGEASCIEELLLFLSYQESRSVGWEKKCVNRNSIARNVVDSFMKIQNEIYPFIEQEYGERKINDEEERVLRLKIAEKYMGYLYWAAYAVS